MNSPPSLANLTLADSLTLAYNPALAISEEAQDLILHHVKISSDPHSARSTRYAFAVVHGNWTVAGHRALYRKPFEEGIYWTCEKGMRLLETLRTRSDRAIAVRDLGGITESMQSIFGNEGGQRTPQTKSAIWLLDIIKASPSVKRLETPLCSYGYIKELADVLGKRGGVEDMTIVSMSMFEVTPVLYSAWTSSRYIESLKKLTLDGFDFRISNPNLVFATAIPSLLFRQSRLTANVILRILPSTPVDLHRMQSLSISSRDGFSSTELEQIFQRIGSTIVDFSLSIEGDLFAEVPTIEGYLNRTGSQADLPSFVFSPFPRLRSLSLQNCRGMTIAKLNIIGADSPHLIKLDLEGTFWSITEEELDPWESEMSTIMRSGYDKLKEMNGGVLPFLDGLFLYQVETVMLEKGVEFVWRGCVRRVSSDDYDSYDDARYDDYEDWTGASSD